MLQSNKIKLKLLLFKHNSLSFTLCNRTFSRKPSKIIYKVSLVHTETVNTNYAALSAWTQTYIIKTSYQSKGTEISFELWEFRFIEFSSIVFKVKGMTIWFDLEKFRIKEVRIMEVLLYNAYFRAFLYKTTKFSTPKKIGNPFSVFSLTSRPLQCHASFSIYFHFF